MFVYSKFVNPVYPKANLPDADLTPFAKDTVVSVNIEQKPQHIVKDIQIEYDFSYECNLV